MIDNIFNLLIIILGISQALFPIVLSIFSVYYFSVKSDKWRSGKSVVIRYVLVSLLIIVDGYFLYGVIFIDPELMFLYWLWPLPTSLALLFVSKIIFKNGKKIEKYLACFNISYSIISLITPFVFIMMK